MRRIGGRKRTCAVFYWKDNLRVVALSDAATFEKAMKEKPEGLIGVYTWRADPKLLAEDLECFARSY
jgi:hypothetical protein